MSLLDDNQIYVHRTLAIVKPNAMPEVDVIEDIILRNGFTILQKRQVHLSPEQASEFYIEHYGKMFFPSLVAYMSSAPIMVFALARNQAIKTWLDLMGPSNPYKARETNPGCLRDTYGKDLMRNGLHGSDLKSCHRELIFMFPNCITEPQLDCTDNSLDVGDSAKDYVEREICPTLLKGLSALCKEKPKDVVTFLADWLIANNPNKPHVQDPVTVTIA